MKEMGDNVGRKRFNDSIEISHRAIEIASRHFNLILRVDEVLMQLYEILVGAQCRIIFDQDEDIVKGLAESGFCILRVGQRGGVLTATTLPGHGFESFLLVLRVIFDDFDEVRNQSVASLELDIDSTPSFTGKIAVFDKLVELKGQQRQGDKGKNDDHARYGIHRSIIISAQGPIEKIMTSF